MSCYYCHRPLRLLDLRRPQRLLPPRCRVCRGYTFRPAHMTLLLQLSAILCHLLIGVLLRRVADDDPWTSPNREVRVTRPARRV